MVTLPPLPLKLVAMGFLCARELFEYTCQLLSIVLVLQDNNIKEILEKGGQTITLTIIPTFIYEHMIKWYVHVQVILSLL